MGLIQSTLNRIGLHTRSEVSELASRVASLETRARFLRPDSSGVDMSFGQYDYELNAALKGKRKWDTLEKMSVDPAVHEGVYLHVLPAITADWTIESESDRAIDKEAADYASVNLLRTTSEQFGREYWCQTSWRGQRLPEILRMLNDGFAMFKKSTKQVNGDWVYDRLQWLEPSSVDPAGWRLSRVDEIEQILRSYSDPKDTAYFWNEIDASEIALYVFGLIGARFEGRPFTRAMYSAWFRKEFVQKMGAVWVQKVGAGIPIVNMPHDANEPDKLKGQRLAEQARGTAPTDAAFAGRRSPEGQEWSLTYAGADAGEVDRVSGVVNSENTEILRAAFQKSRMLGETQSGSRALGESQGAIESLPTQAICMFVCEFENHGVANLPGLVQELHSWKYGKRAKQPALNCTKVSPYEGLEHVDTLVKVWGATGMPVELVRKVTEAAGYTLSDEVYDAIEEQRQAARAVSIDGATDDEKEVAAELGGIRERIAPLLEPDGEGPPAGKMSRRPTKLESTYCALAAVQKSFDDGELKALSVLRATRAKAASIIAQRIVTGKISTRNVASQAVSKPPSAFADRLSDALRVVADEGRGHVRDELRRMGR